MFDYRCLREIRDALTLLNHAGVMLVDMDPGLYGGYCTVILEARRRSSAACVA